MHPKTRERRTIVIELDSDEVADARRNLGIDGPVAKLYTMQKARRCVPAGFDPDLSEHYASATALRENMRPVLIPHPAPRAPVGGADMARSTRIAASYLRKV